MATSTSTLLQVANRAFLNSNERQLTTLTAATAPIAQQMLECVRAAYYKIMREGEWLWTQSKAVAASWSNQVATLSTAVQRVKMVSWQNDDDTTLSIEIPLTFLNRPEFHQYTLDSYNSTTEIGRPLYWTLVDHNVVHVNPYPADATERAKVFFYTNSIPTFPASDAATFSMPEDFIPLLVLLTTAMYIKRHSDDTGLARNFEEEYAIEMIQLRQRQMLVPNNSFNLYRGRKHSSYGVRF